MPAQLLAEVARDLHIHLIVQKFRLPFENREEERAVAMRHKALAVANFFLEQAEEEDAAISPMQLQKLVYFAHGWSLALRNEPLLLEHVEAWDYGPVIPAVYHEFKDFGRNAITRYARTLQLLEPGKGVLDSKFRVVTPAVEKDADAYALLSRVWDVYKEYTGIQLSNMTHEPGGAWYRTYNEHGGKDRRGTDIPDELIKEEFLEKAARSRRAEAT